MRFATRRWVVIAAACLTGLAMLGLTSGCQTSSKPAPQFADVEPGTWEPAPATPALPAAQPAPSVAGQPAGADAVSGSADITPMPLEGRTDLLRVDDVVTVTVTGVSAENIPPHEERIKADGSITLYLVGRIQAAGKSTGELQNELQKLYENYYRSPVLTVKSSERVYYVGGEVKRPGIQLYLGETTVTKAIQAAGDFTDFAQKRSIRVIRANGTTVTVNFNRALNDPRLDPPVFPNDKIHVPRRFLF